ncbi:MAG: protein kinase [Myxococcota bacterium]
MSMAFQGTERFEIRRVLGSGGFGVVYEAFDRDQELAVALKTVRSLDVDAVRSFKREFRALTDFVHPNLVSLYELVTEGEQWFFTMELVEGQDFMSYVRPGFTPSGEDTFNLSILSDDLLGSEGSGGAFAPPPDIAGVLDPERLRVALEQVVHGLGAMHDSRILHRDVKPSNILVDARDRLVLLDFGLAAELAARRHGRQRVRIGTPAYMAPETAAGKDAGPASDWYSVGCLLYEALTGQVPFLGAPRQILAAKRMRTAPSPLELNPDAPRDLVDLCLALLRTEPGDRPTASEIRKKLGIRVGASGRGAFVGRDAELRQLSDAVTRVLPGKPRVVVVTGPSGMGKSVLAEQFVAELRDDTDVLAFSGRCYERESVPFKALDELVDDVAAHLLTLPAADRARYQPEHDAALMRVFQSFDGIFERTSPTDLEAGELRRRAGLALRELLTALARDAFVMLYIDDIQWGDADSAALLVELLQPPDPPPIFLIATMRPEGAETDVPSALAELERLGIAVERLEVGALEEPAARRMLKGRVKEEAVPALLAEANGTPFLLDALARHVQEFDAEGPVSVAGIVRQRRDVLPGAARRLLEFIAVAGQPVGRDILREATGMSGDHAAVSRLVRAHLVRSLGVPGKERVVAYHDRIRETVVEDLAAGAVDIHRSLAEAMDRLGTDAERRFVHHRAAGNVDRARLLAIEAAEGAADTLAFAHAARLYGEAIALGEESWEVHHAQAQALVSAGRPYEAGEAYLQAADRAPADEQVELRRAAAEQFLAGGHADRGVQEMSKVLEVLGLALAKSPNTALARLLWNRGRLWWRGLGYTLRDDVTRAELLEVDTLWSVASAMSVMDTIRATDFQVRHLLRALDVGEPYRICRALALEGAYSVTESTDHLPRSEEILAEAEKLAVSIERPHGRAIVQLQRGIRAFLVSRWPESCEALEKAEDLLRECRGVTWELSQVATFHVDALSLRGDWHRLKRIIGPRLTEARQNGNLQLVHYLEYARALFVRIAEDDPDPGLQAMQETFVHRARHGFTTPDWWRMMGLSMLHAYKGESQAAWDAWEADWPALKSSLLLRVDVMNVPGRYHRARLALGLARDGGDTSYCKLARKEAAAIAKSSSGWGPALARLIDALCAHQEGDDASALTQLADAEAQLLALDMRLHAFSARLRRGQWSGDPADAGLIESARGEMRALGIQNPDRFASVFAPEASRDR